jgi:hypothetical protein
MKIAVNDLIPNPFRNLDRYPIDPAKVAALKASINSTSFWDNLLVRKSPDQRGKFELAYGHHRWKALQSAHEEYIDIPVRELSDTIMAKIMAEENREEWGSTTEVEQETVRAIVEGYGAGRIELPQPSRNASHVRFAPEFRSGSGVERTSSRLPYTIETLSKFLNWNESKIKAILNILEIGEAGLIDADETAGLTSYQAEQAAVQARRIHRETQNPDLARRVGSQLAAGMRTASDRRSGRGSPPTGTRQAVTVHNARRVADEMAGTRRPQHRVMPNLSRFCEMLTNKIGEMLPKSGDDTLREKLNAVIQWRAETSAGDRNRLVSALRGLAKRANLYADRLEAEQERIGRHA